MFPHLSSLWLHFLSHTITGKGPDLRRESVGWLSCLLSLLLGLFTALVGIGGAQAPFIIAIPSFPFNCFLSLVVFISGGYE